MNKKLLNLWRWDGTVGRLEYFGFGTAPLLVKLVLDRTISSFAFNRPWSLFDYENPAAAGSPDQNRAELLSLLAASLPFLWIGIALTLRRSRSAGLPLWLVVLFVVPVVKLIFFAILSLLPPKSPSAEISNGQKIGNDDESYDGHVTRDAAFAISTTIALTVPAVWLGTNVLENYGWSLFVGLPFCMGFVSVLLFGLRRRRTYRQSMSVALATVGGAGAMLLLFYLEGIICLLMAAPLVIVLALLGASVAFIIQHGHTRRADSPRLFCMAILAVPFTMGLEHYESPEAPLLQVTSSVVVNAPPEMVWRNVVSFSELPPPHELLFLAGIAYPIRAEIRGQGVGAVRYCRFSTGPFVEPIEVWDEPRLLKFSVTDNPAPMRELSLYHDLEPPHLHGFLVSREGQFYLIPLDNGRTLLEGTTWYQHHLWPARYWQIWSDYIIHRIHLRVLDHVKELSEADTKK